VYETTYGVSQNGAATLQTGAPLHDALAPSAHRLKVVHPPGIMPSTRLSHSKTEWQSVRVSHPATVSSLEQGPGIAQPVTHPKVVPGSAQPTNVRREQPVQ
jgi:hypothetical protein